MNLCCSVGRLLAASYRLQAEVLLHPYIVLEQSVLKVTIQDLQLKACSLKPKRIKA
jgi:hypothetical protein